jgi:cytochrome P450
MICGFFPWPLKYLVERFLPLCRKVRRDRRECAKKLIPVLKERNAIVAKAEREGKKPDVPNDAIEWFRASSKGRIYDEVDIQITLQVAAIHTTSDLLTQTVLNLCAHPELFAPLREEAVIVLRKYGWQKLALTELRLLDSVFKETQRLKPVTMASMHREALADVKLANGILIRKGEHLGIFSRNMWNGDIYENPEKFDGFRFLKRREIPGQENRSLLVSTSPDHLGFAHGV